ncbi:tryptophan--tRNA ligase [Nocardioides nanhaiensis]|uniref:Tryptophan--tRNA ligase n=1 Tax=Nocardioides nanhaiensis TaxID=1476871 RepID=A0ABP8WF77_9ACTN
MSEINQPPVEQPAEANEPGAAGRPGVRRRMLTGDRPTGKLHLGHYVGSISNRVKLQHDYECFFIIADLHMLTTKSSREAIEQIGPNARDAVLDMISAGIDPEQATFYLQSGLGGAIHELYTLFQSLITVPHLQRLPSLKDMARGAGKAEMPFALLGYPILQAADILCVRSQMVPVGKDNLAHVEITREIARRFNHEYGETLPVPEALVGEVPTLVGTDGNGKASKSLGNAILLSDDAATVRRKVKGMFTDPNRVRADVPGETETNPVFVYHRTFNDRPEEVADLTARYQAGTVGDVEVKQSLIEALERFLAPIRERRAEFESRPGYVEQLIVEGTERTRHEAELTLREVRKAMGLASSWNRLRRKAERHRG